MRIKLFKQDNTSDRSSDWKHAGYQVKRGDTIMKYGVRKPSIKRSISARTTGRVKRSVNRAINPFYGKKGTGFIRNPHKAVYNAVYHKTTVGVSDIAKAASREVGKTTAHSRPHVTQKIKPMSAKRYHTCGAIILACGIIMIPMGLLLLFATAMGGVLALIFGMFNIHMGKIYMKKKEPEGETSGFIDGEDSYGSDNILTETDTINTGIQAAESGIDTVEYRREYSDDLLRAGGIDSAQSIVMYLQNHGIRIEKIHNLSGADNYIKLPDKTTVCWKVRKKLIRITCKEEMAQLIEYNAGLTNTSGKPGEYCYEVSNIDTFDKVIATLKIDLQNT